MSDVDRAAPVIDVGRLVGIVVGDFGVAIVVLVVVGGFPLPRQLNSY